VRGPSPRALFIAGALALAGFLVGVLATRPADRTTLVTTTATSVSTTVATTTATTPAPTIPAGFAVYDVAVEQQPFAATIRWRTTEPSTATVSWAPAGLQPYLWTHSRAPSFEHEVHLPALAANASYDVAIDARNEDGAVAHADVPLTAAAAPAAVIAAARDGVVRVNGGAFFPLITWQECPGQWEPDLAQGITLFAGNPCTGLANLLAALGGRALAAGTTEDVADTTGPGLLGWFHADEADARGLTGDSLTRPVGGLGFLTLTSHFFSGAAPLPAGRGMYPGLIAQADVVGFDLYPLQELCRPDMLPAVFDAQRELIELTGGKPTFQWIETREMKCPQTPVTTRTITVESWLALAGGAHGLGFFPSDRHEPATTALANVMARIRQLEPVLLRPPAQLTVSTASQAVRASARSFGGAYYVIAVNAGATRANVTLDAPALGDQSVETVGSAQVLQAHAGSVTLTLPPLGVRVLVARGS
jgi:hypothetical protein